MFLFRTEASEFVFCRSVNRYGLQLLHSGRDGPSAAPAIARCQAQVAAKTGSQKETLTLHLVWVMTTGVLGSGPRKFWVKRKDHRRSC